MEKQISGVSLREPHFSIIRGRAHRIQAIEVVSENYLFTRGERRTLLQELSENFFIHLHGMTTNIGSSDELNLENLDRLKILARDTQAQLLSDHLCFTRIDGQSTFDLLPIPRTARMVDHVGRRLERIQERLGTEFLLENISSYFTYQMDEMSELEFMSELHKKYGAKYLLDVNNLFVSSKNLSYSATRFLEGLPRTSVAAYHLGGHEVVRGFLFDTHGAKVNGEVEHLFQLAVSKFGRHPVFLERDENIPHDIDDLEQEISQISRRAGYNSND
jgi:hypothetical protein